ncbi:MAG: hypothetical protein NZ732_00550 [Candidatus Poseidoniales archaeon]|nr:hypothetical protein [Candidatus Poseidoniales archaeon]MDP6562161.1 hypothetical protein [Candidatus Thalassarchaeum sp.]
MAERIEVAVPVRVDLAGGWTDVQPYAGDFGGEVVNFAINRYIRSVMEKDADGRIRVEYTSDMPTGSGLGTSGAMNVGLIATITGGGKSPEDIAELAFQFEALLENRGGRQDQWAAARGGFNHLLFLGDEVEEIPFEPMKSARNWLRKHFVIAYSGIEHKSGDIHSGVWERYDQGDESVIAGLHLIRGAARKMADGLQRDRRELVVEALKDVCEGVDLLDSSIHDPFREVISPLQEAGSVVAWKALGAGGGGSVGLLCSPMGVSAAISAIEEAGWEIVEWDYENHGVQVK